MRCFRMSLRCAPRSEAKSSICRLPARQYPASPGNCAGLHKIAEIKRLEGKCKINHIFFSLPSFPVLRMLRNPTFYTVTATLHPKRKPRNIAQLLQLNCIIVSNDRDAGILEAGD